MRQGSRPIPGERLQYRLYHDYRGPDHDHDDHYNHNDDHDDHHDHHDNHDDHNDDNCGTVG